MRFFDIIGLSFASLFRRRARTILTVLGVFIGAASIVLMLSLGIGLKQSFIEMYEVEGSQANKLTISLSENNPASYLTDDVIEELEKQPFVEKIRPKLICPARITQGKWAVDVNILGLTKEELGSLKLTKGALSEDTEDLQLIVGNRVIQEVYNYKTGEYPFYDKGEYADMDFFADTLRIQFVTDDFEVDAYGHKEYTTKKRKLNIAGETSDMGMEGYCYCICADIDALKGFMDKEYRGKSIPGQPVRKNGRPYGEYIYPLATVTINGKDNLPAAKEYFTENSYQVMSNDEIIKEIEKNFNIVQAVLGGIGAVSLLVAAIGIANTMTMSIYERTKEIGVMKVLGCDLKNIRWMFLTEAGLIGLIGGIVGVVVSYGLSMIINVIAGPLIEPGMVLTVSRIPITLAVLALIFSTLIGMFAGLLPANKAMRLSPLAAIRNE